MFFVGLDLGKSQDPAAVAVVDRPERPAAFRTSSTQLLAVRLLERMALGTPYPQVVERVREILAIPELRGQSVLVVDGTGVGAPVVDMLRMARLGCEICAVTMTSGERASQNGSSWNVPKRDLIASVQVALERKELRIASRLKDAGVLVKELLDMKVTVKAGGRTRMGADGCGQHDDLVIAVALACWRARRGMVGPGAQGLVPGICGF